MLNPLENHHHINISLSTGDLDEMCPYSQTSLGLNFLLVREHTCLLLSAICVVFLFIDSQFNFQNKSGKLRFCITPDDSY